MSALTEIGARARAAARTLSICRLDEKNAALLGIAEALMQNSSAILKANDLDLSQACENGLPKTMLDRLRLSPARIEAMAEGARQVAALPDPVGKVLSMERRPNGLLLGKRTVPLGVIGIIFEARPNVTVDAAALCLKAGNAVILRGGKEAIESNKALVSVMRTALLTAGLPKDAVCLVEDTSRQSAVEMMTLSGVLDVLIPRGGAGLIRSVVENARVPVIETGVGNCHIYVDRGADLDMAVSITENAKCSRPSVCNAAETLLVHKDEAERFLPMAARAMERVALRGCARTLAILGDRARPACEEDWAAEYNDYILAVRVVDSMDEAMEHIAKYGSGHSEAIVTRDYARAQRFLDQVDSAAVYVNASTRFTDGFEFGLGAEIGISTQKLHARGPMGLAELCSTKSVIYGDGQIRI